MQNRSVVTGLVLLLTLSVPSEAVGQVGAIIDWINGLSGPRVVRAGPEITLARLDDRNHINLAPLLAVDVGDRGNADTQAADISAFSIQASLESTLLGQGGAAELRSRLGFEVHRFSGQFDSFWAPSFPALVVLHVPLGGWAFAVGTGFNVFNFPDGAFAPYNVGVVSDGFDAGWTVQGSIEIGDFVLLN